ncbi:MAG: OmpA family protein [Ignavibacteriaceae bacterium]
MLLLLLLTFCLPNSIFAQFQDYGFKLGVKGNYLVVGNEYTEEEYNPSLLFRLNGTFELSRIFDLEIGVGYGYMQGEDYTLDQYKTTFMPVDLRLVLSPFNSTSVNPYLYIGGGISYWDLTDPPANPVNPPDDENGIVTLGVAGIGLEIALSQNVLLDITGGFNMFGHDDVNGDATNLQDKTLHDFDRYINVGLGLTYVFGTCDTDEDMDGLNKCTEDSLGTDPKNPDSDGDGLKDGEEVTQYKTNPLNPDTDADGLKDGEEVFTYKTNPLVADTDGDGLKDGEEVTRYKTDPTNPDTDGDGLSDGSEVMDHKTDPLKADTDGDGLTDGEEVNGTNLDLRVVGKEVKSGNVKTDPLNADSDGDGLKDGEEMKRYFTDPNNKDTDAGSVDDGTEIANQTDPLDPMDDKAMDPGLTLDIKFKQGSAVIQTDYLDDLQRAFAYLKEKVERKFEIHGYTSTEGSEAFNQTLSEKRANAVVNWFRESGIAQERMTAIGHGECCPILVNNEEDRPASRRIVLVLK